MFKLAETKSQLPVEGQDILVPLDIDGTSLPSDWYLQLADQTQQMLDGSIPLTSVIPIAPITAEGNGSEYVSQQNVPFTLELDEKVTVSVTFKNIGTSTWTKANGYFLGSQNPQDNNTWGLNRVPLSDSDNILSGEEKTFEFEITAPGIAGYYNFQWRMLQDGVEWFGQDTTNALIIVGGGGDYLDDCDSQTDWNPISLTLNTTDKIQGVGCLEFLGANTDEYSKVFAAPYNANGTESGTVLQFWYYVSDVSQLGNENQVEIGSSGRPDSNEYNWSLNDLNNGWNFIQLNTSNAGKIGNPDLSAINWFRLYRFKSGSVTTRINNLSISDFDANTAFSLYPNPANTEVNIAFRLTQPSKVNLTLVNIMGQVVSRNINNETLHTGQHTLEIPLNDLNSGIYFARLNIDGNVFTKKIIKK